MQLGFCNGSRRTPAGNQIAEYATALGALRSRASCYSRRLADILGQCPDAHGVSAKRHLVECDDCCDRALATLQAPFLPTAVAGDEWFAHVENFAPTLCDHITYIRARRRAPPTVGVPAFSLAAELATIDRWLAAQKELWFCAQLTRSRSLLVAAATADHETVSGSAMQSPLAAPGPDPVSHQQRFAAELEWRLTDEGLRTGTLTSLIDAVTAAVGTPAGWWGRGMYDVVATVEAGMEQEDFVSRQAYARLIFVPDALEGPSARPGGSRNWRGFVDMYLGTPDPIDDVHQSLFDVVSTIAARQSDWVRERPLRDAARRRRDEVRRALIAFRQPYSAAAPTYFDTRDGARASATIPFKSEQHQARSSGNFTSSLMAGPQNHRTAPNCLGCGAVVSGDSASACAVCLLQAELGMQADAATAMYCSDRCRGQVHDEHTQLAHYCEAGPACTSRQRPDRPDHDDTPPQDPVLCGICLDAHFRLALFCSKPCAERDAVRHTNHAHARATAFRTMGLVQTLEARLNARIPGSRVAVVT